MIIERDNDKEEDRNTWRESQKGALPEVVSPAPIEDSTKHNEGPTDADGVEADEEEKQGPIDKEKKGRGRPAKKAGHEPKIDKYFLRARGKAGSTNGDKIPRTPPAAWRSHSVPRDGERAQRGIFEEEEVDNPPPEPDKEAGAGLLNDKGRTESLNRGAEAQVKDAGVDTEAQETPGGELAEARGLEQTTKAKKDVGVGTDWENIHKCSECGDWCDPDQKRETRAVERRLAVLEGMMMEVLSKVNQGAADGVQRLSPLLNEALNCLLSEVGEVKDEVGTLKRWVAEGFDDVRAETEKLGRKVGMVERVVTRPVSTQEDQMKIDSEKNKERELYRNTSLNGEMSSDGEASQVGETALSGNDGLNDANNNSVSSISTPDTQKILEEKACSQNKQAGVETDKNPLEGLAWRQGAPEKLSKGELHQEKKERRKRRNNVTVRGLRTSRGVEPTDFVRLVRQATGRSVTVLAVKDLGPQGLLFTLATREQKRQLMRGDRLEALESQGVEVRDDFTPRQKQVNKHLSALATRARDLGKKASVRSYQQNIWVNEAKYHWDEETAELVAGRGTWSDDRTTRNEQQQNYSNVINGDSDINDNGGNNSQI